MSRRSRALLALAALAVLIIAATLIAVLLARRAMQHPLATAPPPPSPPIAAPVTSSSGLPVIADKPVPLAADFDGCPGAGRGGDPALNRLKNRTDTAAAMAVEFRAVADLSWPREIERRDRADWPADAAAAVAQWEGLSLSIEGYLADARAEGAESCNCGQADPDHIDYHLWLLRTPGDTKAQSIVVEVSPRIRRDHPAWGIKALKRLARDRDRVRISGWLMLDPEHPDQIGKTRETLWELHPITQIEVFRANAWQPLDSMGG